MGDTQPNVGKSEDHSLVQASSSFTIENYHLVTFRTLQHAQVYREFKVTKLSNCCRKLNERKLLFFIRSETAPERNLIMSHDTCLYSLAP